MRWQARIGSAQLARADKTAFSIAALEDKCSDMVLGPDYDVLLGLEALHDDSLRQNASEIKNNLYALKHRTPGSHWSNEDVEPALPCVVAINLGERVPLGEGLNQTFLDRNETVVVFRSSKRELHDELGLGHGVLCEA